MPLCFEYFTFDVREKRNDIKREALMFNLLFLVFSNPRRFLLSQNPFLVATVRLSLEKLRLDDVEEST